MCSLKHQYGNVGLQLTWGRWWWWWGWYPHGRGWGRYTRFDHMRADIVQLYQGRSGQADLGIIRKATRLD